MTFKSSGQETLKPLLVLDGDVMTKAAGAVRSVVTFRRAVSPLPLLFVAETLIL